MSNPIIKAEWLAYLQGQGLRPVDFGAATWEGVLPYAERRATALSAKRRFYWTARFASAASTAHFARATRAIQANVSGFAVPTYANFNCWQGRVWTPDVGNTQNINKTDENAAEIGNDWFEFGRARGTKLMWYDQRPIDSPTSSFTFVMYKPARCHHRTEDWLPDHQAAQWSYYSSKMRSAARLSPSGDMGYGGYVVAAMAGERPHGILQKVLSLIGGGAKALVYFTFGPDYTFPVRACYVSVRL